MTEVEVDPRTVLELAVILRTKMLSKVRMLDVACEAEHRLVQVLRVARRPFVLGIDTTVIHGLDEAARKWYWFPTPKGEWAMGRRGRWLGVWLDEPDQEIRTVNGPQLHNRFTFTCADWHCSKEITLPWLREQIAADRRRVVITAKR
jgi:hypothetical protein